MAANYDSDHEEDKPAVVLDNGSGMIKAGISGEDAPKVTFARRGLSEDEVVLNRN